ncbi:hotdog domain-containing protein [Melghirimyces thermohalophilus]|uniref:hotdog domain-containing protein n=1 Tax=Melghirimyces thermohalophilus TaxID=1236220 RepID=UPI0015A199F2
MERLHFNGNGTAHGGVLSSLLDNAVGLAIQSVSGAKAATTQMIHVDFIPQSPRNSSAVTGKCCIRPAAR